MKKRIVGTLLAVVVAVMVVGIFSATTSSSIIIQSAQAYIDPTHDLKTDTPKAPSVVSGDNIYIAWWTNNTENGNEEVMFRASHDAGQTFTDKINLSNTTDADSGRVEIAAEGATVMVTWWERNQTSDVPVARISTDGGETFGAMLRVGMNGTISGTEEGGG